MATIQTAFNQYATRPADERYPSVDALIHAAMHDKMLSLEKTVNLKDLKLATAQTGERTELMMQSPKGLARISHWAFGQFARTVGAPAGYLRELPPYLAADNLNYGISQHSGDVNLLVKMANGDPTPLIRAATSDSYGRVWDADLFTQAQQQIFSQGSSNPHSGKGWELPPTWTGEPAGAYRGDRDSFLIQVDGGSIVNNPSRGAGTSAGGGRQMFRGIMIGNSEVGKSSVWIDCVLFDYVCGNHMLWGATIDQSFRRRHVGTKVLRDTIREIGQVAYKWARRSTALDDQIVKTLIEKEIAISKDAVVDELTKLGCTKADAIGAYERCEQTESVSPRSFWGVAQGLTRLSQDSGFQDERYSLDKLAAQILKLGSRVTA